jgi:4-amino-4-deoxy-L-arabinose transferase-like glycosyltransferase
MNLLKRFKTMLQRHQRSLLVTVLLAVLLVPRMAHFAGSIDEPHSWRQCDTANYALTFYKEGIRLLRPSVCWMGSYKTVILEFPFPEALMALMYHILGYHLYLARVVTFLFFAGSAIYLYLIVCLVLRKRLAIIATAVYMILPLSLFYSRAVHVDFFAVFFAHAMTYHLLRASQEPSLRHLILGLVGGCMAFLIKAPYAFYFGLPLLALTLHGPKLRKIVCLAAGLCVPILVFIVWRGYADAINGTAPEWGFLPGYFKLVNLENWYYGPLEMRWNPTVWQTLFSRFIYEVASPAGAALFMIGAFLSFINLLRRHSEADLFLWAWLLGVLSYVAVFLNLNFIHDYYQIPLLAIASIFIAIAIELPLRLFGHSSRKFASILSLLLYGLVAVNSLTYAETHFFKLDSIRIEAGEVINRHTPPGALIIAAPDVLGTDCRDPRLLYRAKRNGWSIPKEHLSRDLIAALKGLGAQYLIVVAPAENADEICGYRVEAHPLSNPPWNVFIAKL